MTQAWDKEFLSGSSQIFRGHPSAFKMGFGGSGKGSKDHKLQWANINSIGPRVKEFSSVQRYIAKHKIKLI